MKDDELSAQIFKGRLSKMAMRFFSLPSLLGLKNKYV